MFFLSLLLSSILSAFRTRITWQRVPSIVILPAFHFIFEVLDVWCGPICSASWKSLSLNHITMPSLFAVLLEQNDQQLCPWLGREVGIAFSSWVFSLGSIPRINPASQGKLLEEENLGLRISGLNFFLLQNHKFAY